MRLRFFERQHGGAVGLIEFSEEMFDEGLEQKYDGQALHALALTLQRKPWPIWFVAQNDLGFGK